jgi:hypothetical protein
MQAIPVNSGVPTRCNVSEQFAAAIANWGGQTPQRNLPSNHFRFFLGHACFGFLVKKIFLAIKNKIHFFLVDFESGF